MCFASVERASDQHKRSDATDTSRALVKQTLLLPELCQLP